MRSLLLAAAGAALSIAASPVRAQMVDAADAPKLSAAMQEMGWLAKLGKDSEGDPKITSKVGGSEYQIQFYGCTDHTGCKSILFTSSYTVKKKLTPAQANEWNLKHRFGSITVDSDGDPRLTMPVNLDGGVSAKNFEDTLDWWRTTMTDFEKSIGF
jgi:hypothetical protein